MLSGKVGKKKAHAVVHRCILWWYYPKEKREIVTERQCLSLAEKPGAALWEGLRMEVF